jgi:hypothetical protein|tara:strand:- start:3454 stop:3708 length:255 start_codon:yes stop_codon:yes gene_type:complete
MNKTPVPVSECGEPPRGNSNIKICVWGNDPEKAMDRYNAGRNSSREVGDPVLEKVGRRWRVSWKERIGLAEVVKFPWRRNKKGK